MQMYYVSDLRDKLQCFCKNHTGCNCKFVAISCYISQMVQDNARVITEEEYEVIYTVLNGWYHFQ